jgi:hypothetical protein
MTAELALVANPDDIAALPAEQRGQMITRALVESKSWLAVATKGTDPTPVAEFKAWAATVAEMTRQKGLSEEIQLNAQEMVRRAERGIGLVVKQGQEAGVVRGSGDRINPANQHGPSAATNNVKSSESPSPKDFFANNREYVDANDMTTGVSEEDFEEAIEEAREERNLTRRNVARKTRERSGRAAEPRDTRPDKLARLDPVEQVRLLAANGQSSRQIAEELGVDAAYVRKLAKQEHIDIGADRLVGKTHHIDSTRVVEEAVNALQGIEYTLSLLTDADYDAFAPSQVKAWLGALNEPARSIRILVKELNRRV